MLDENRAVMSTAYLGLGSNEGDRLRHLQTAVEQLHGRETLRVETASPVYETEAHTVSPEEEQPSFLNAVLQVGAECSPEVLLHHAHAVERAEGRTRSAGQKWRPRPLDIDLLAVGAVRCQTDTLTLPHPRLGERRFVLRPWADLAPNFVVPPPFDQTVHSLLDQCPDTTDIRRTRHTLNDRANAAPPSEDS